MSLTPEEMQALNGNGKSRRPRSQTSADRHASQRAQASTLADRAKDSLVTSHQQQLERLDSALTKAEEKRDQTLEILSDRMAHLQDGTIFMLDLMDRTQQKLRDRTNSEPVEDAPAVEVIEGLIEGFEALGHWEYPTLSPYSVAGCLPL